MNDLVRVKLENGMEASLPREHAINSGYEPLTEKGVEVPSTNTLGNAIPASGADEKLLAKRESQLAALAKAAPKTAASGDNA